MASPSPSPDDRYFPATGMPDRDWWQALWPDPAGTLRALGAAQGMQVVDLCCGDGYFTAPLARIVAPGSVLALDLSAEMLRQARAEVVAQGAANVTFVEGDARELPGRVPAPVDWVLIANTFHGVPDKAGLAAAVRQVLKPTGRLAIVNWHALPREQTPVLEAPRGPRSELRMTPDAVYEAVRPAGLEQVGLVELPPYHYGILLAPA